MNIHELRSKIKTFIQGNNTGYQYFDEEGELEQYPLFRKLSLALIIILVALLSFGIGKLSSLGEREPIKIEYDSQPTTYSSQPTANTNIQNGGVVASKNGTKYHYSYCPGAKQIKEENKLLFASAVLAERAGYTLASNCSPR